MQAQTTYRPLALTIFSPASTLQRYLVMAALVIGGSIFVALSCHLDNAITFKRIGVAFRLPEASPLWILIHDSFSYR